MMYTQIINISETLFEVLLSFCLILFFLVGIAYLTLLERKIMASIQRRRGPTVVGIFGLLQPLADGLKLLVKETIVPSYANLTIFFLSPIFTFFCSLILWVSVPFNEGLVFIDISMGVLYVFAISSLSVYGIIFAGWSSNSKYSFLGGLRSAAQMISYEICIGLVLIGVILFTGSFHLGEIVLAQTAVWYCFPLLPLYIIFVIASLAETNRAPFDLPEAEAELVAGYNVEYSAMGFALFFLGEYGNIIFMSSLTSILFLGGWLPLFNLNIFYLVPPIIWFFIKLAFSLFVFIWVRAAYPRFRYDQLMRLGWKVLLPFSLAFVYFESAVCLSFGLLPYII